MIAVTTSGARLLHDDADHVRLARLVVAIAEANGYPGTNLPQGTGYAGALDWLVQLDPPTGDDDVVIWSWTDQPTKSVHVTRPQAVKPAPAVIGKDARGRFVRVA